MVDIDFIDFRVPLTHVRRNNIIDAIIGNFATLFSHEDIVKLQIGVRCILDGDTGSGIGLQIPRSDEVISRHVDIAAACGDVRNLHIIDGTAGTDIYRLASGILLRKPQTFHVTFDSITFREIGRHHLGAAIFLVFPIICFNQSIEFLPPRTQVVGIVKSSLRDAVLHPIVGVVVVGRYRQSVRHAAANGQIDGVGSARDQ